MKRSKIIMMSLGGAICLAAASQSFAAIEVYSQQSAVNPVPSSYYPIYQTFATATNGGSLTVGSLNFNCTFSLTVGFFEWNPGFVEVVAVGGNASGSGLDLIPCMAVNLTGFPWPAEYVSADLPLVTAPLGDVPIRFSNVGMSLCSPSSGLTVDAIFNNNNNVLLTERSSFSFVNATLWDVPPAVIGATTGGTPSNCTFTGNLLTPVGGDVDIVWSP